MSEEIDGNTFLSEAIDAGDIELVRAALAQGADPNAGADQGHSLLYSAVIRRDMPLIHLLLASGARVAAESEFDDDTSLHYAVEHNDMPLVELLLSYDGACALDWFDDIDRTPLMIAVEQNHLALAERLIAAGADVNAHNEARAGDTALHSVARNGTLEMARLLVRAGADPLVRGWMWITPLDNAQQRKRLEGRAIAELLENAAGQAVRR
jgi:ankyrin repeat protein